MTREFLIISLADKIKENDEDYNNAKEFVNDFFKDDHINIIKLYYINKKWTQALKILFEDWKEGD